MAPFNKTIQKSFLINTRFLWLGLLFLGFAMLFQSKLNNATTNAVKVQRIEKRVNQELKALDDQMLDLRQRLDSFAYSDFLAQEDSYIERLVQDGSGHMYLFQDDSLLLWTSNYVPLEKIAEANLLADTLIRFDNLWALVHSLSFGNYHLIGLLPLQHQYPIENRYLKNEFLFGRGHSRKLQIVQADDSVNLYIRSRQGKVLFGFISPDWSSKMQSLKILAILGFVGFILFLLAFMQDLIRLGNRLWPNNLWLLAYLADLVLMKWLFSNFKFPGVFYSSDLFESFSQPIRFMDSRGEILISLIFLLFFAMAFQRWFKLYPKSLDLNPTTGSQRTIDSFSAIGWLFIFGLFFALFWFYKYLLHSREGLLEIHKVLSINAITALDLGLLALGGLVFFLIMRKISQLTLVVNPGRRFIIVPLVVGVVFFSFTRFIGLGPDLVCILYFISPSHLLSA